jgi:CBS domain-containing protein
LAKVVEVMSRGVDPVDPAATVQQAATQMAELDVGAVVIGTADKIEGILTDRDIILRVVVDGRNPAEVPVRDVMSSTIFACAADDPVEAVLVQMRQRQIRRMPVYDETGKPVGIVTLSDVSRAVDGPEHLAEALREIAEPHRARKIAEADEPPTASADAAMASGTGA